MAAEKPARAAEKEPEPAPAPVPALVSAAASGDPAVQNLLAAREVHVRNGDAGAVAGVDAALASLGFTI